MVVGLAEASLEAHNLGQATVHRIASIRETQPIGKPPRKQNAAAPMPCLPQGVPSRQQAIDENWAHPVLVLLTLVIKRDFQNRRWECQPPDVAPLL